VEVAVAATEFKARKADKAGAIIAAALALPGIMAPLKAFAENAPEHGEVAVKYLQYQDSQPGLKRIKVTAPSVYVLAPISPQWSVEGSLVSDSVSGATPRYHSAISGATPRMNDERNAGDVKVTRYAARSTYAVGVNKSKEHDYDSTALSFDASFSSEDNNRTWNFGLGYSSDKISSTIDPLLREKKHTTELMVGVTQALTANDLLQVNVTLNSGKGYYSDPYKTPDVRPNQRTQSILLTRWNHHFTDMGATLRTSYRLYHDTFGINAHTLGAEWVQPVGQRFKLTPSLRLYSQSAAKFYFDPVYDVDVGAPYPPGYFTNPPAFASPDQRLAAFGGLTVGLKAAMQITPDWAADVKLERYEQRSNWRVGGKGSPGIDPFTASFLQVGVSKRF
jgi:Protein of unknown function (DUF3570)